MEKRSTGLRLPEEAKHLQAAMATAPSIARTAMLEIARGEPARKRGLHANIRLQAESQPEPTSRDRGSHSHHAVHQEQSVAALDGYARRKPE